MYTISTGIVSRDFWEKDAASSGENAIVLNRQRFQKKNTLEGGALYYEAADV